MTQKDYMTTKIKPPQRWAQQDEKGRKTGDFGAYHTQKAGFPRKLALRIGQARFSYMKIVGKHSFLQNFKALDPTKGTNVHTYKVLQTDKDLCYDIA